MSDGTEGRVEGSIGYWTETRIYPSKSQTYGLFSQGCIREYGSTLWSGQDILYRMYS